MWEGRRGSLGGVTIVMGWMENHVRPFYLPEEMLPTRRSDVKVCLGAIVLWRIVGGTVFLLPLAATSFLFDRFFY